MGLLFLSFVVNVLYKFTSTKYILFVSNWNPPVIGTFYPTGLSCFKISFTHSQIDYCLLNIAFIILRYKSFIRHSLHICKFFHLFNISYNKTTNPGIATTCCVYSSPLYIIRFLEIYLISIIYPSPFNTLCKNCYFSAVLIYSVEKS